VQRAPRDANTTPEPASSALPVPATARRRILLVGGEEATLDAYREGLAVAGVAWDVVYAVGGNAGLRSLETARFDAVVVDAQMPHPDGASVLTDAKRRMPLAVRIALSDGGADESAARAIPVAQQFLGKPCDAATLAHAVDRACDLRSLVADDRVRSIVGLIGVLPAQPQVYTALMRKLQSPNSSVSSIARLLERDLALCSKILHISNSALFSLPRQVMDLETAVSLLGSSAILSLVLSLSIFETGVYSSAISSPTLQRHSLLTSAIARHIARGTRHEDHATIAGMLHDLGVLILATKLPGHAHRVLQSIAAEPRRFHEVERELWGVTHAEIGAYLLAVWGLPYPVVEAVAFHHRPMDVRDPGFDALAAVYFADCIAHEVDPDSQHAAGDVPPTLDPEYADRLGVADRLDDWRHAAALLAQQDAGSE
jgi:HD-like signal output (HDOD) protein